MSGLYVADKEIRVMMRDLIKNYHPHLATLEEQIAIVFKEKASGPEGKKILGKSSKASPLVNALAAEGQQWTFVITLAQDTWLELNSQQQVALLDRHLCAFQVEEDSESGDVKYNVVSPDVVAFRGEIERHGIWWTGSTGPNPALAETLCGEAPSADTTQSASLE